MQVRQSCKTYGRCQKGRERLLAGVKRGENILPQGRALPPPSPLDALEPRPLQSSFQQEVTRCFSFFFSLQQKYVSKTYIDL